jgi:DNA-directed RNA polymerase subunit RPC12/RpoP
MRRKEAAARQMAPATNESMGVASSVRVARKKACPHCGGKGLARLRRSLCMLWFVGSRLYRCTGCGRGVLYVPKS